MEHLFGKKILFVILLAHNTLFFFALEIIDLPKTNSCILRFDQEFNSSINEIFSEPTNCTGRKKSKIIPPCKLNM